MWTEILARGSFGTYAQAVPFIERFGNPAAAAEAGNATMMLFARNLNLEAEKQVGVIQAEAKKNSQFMGGNLKYDDAKQIALQQLFKQHSAIADKGADKASISQTDSPYRIDYDAAYAAAIGSGTKGNVVIDALAAAKGADPYTQLKGKVTDRFIIDRIGAEVMAGKVDPAKAAKQVAEFYSSMSAQTYQDSGLKYFGLPQLQDYSMSLGQKGSNKVDLFNATRVENYFTAQAAAFRTQQKFEQTVWGAAGDPLRTNEGTK
jgi:hypothetical protein